VSDLLTDLLAPLDVPSCRHRGDNLTCAPAPGIAATFIRVATDALGPGRTRTGEIPACRRDRLARSLPFYALCEGPLSRHPHGPSRTGGRVRWRSFEHQSFHPPDRCAPAFPTRSDVSPSDACAPNCLSWGCQIPPLRRLQPGSPLGCVRTSPCSRHRAGLATPDRVPPSWFLTTSTGFSSLTASGCCTRIRPWGSSCFRLLRNRLPHDAFLPFRALLPDGSGDPRPKPRTAGDRHRGPTLPPYHRSPVALPPRRCASTRLRALPSRPRGLAPPSEP